MCFSQSSITFLIINFKLCVCCSFLLFRLDRSNSDGKTSLKWQKSPETTANSQDVSNFYWFTWKMFIFRNIYRCKSTIVRSSYHIIPYNVFKFLTVPLVNQHGVTQSLTLSWINRLLFLETWAWVTCGSLGNHLCFMFSSWHWPRLLNKSATFKTTLVQVCNIESYLCPRCV